MLTQWADTWHKLIWLHVASCVSVWMCMCLHACKCVCDRECVDVHTIECCLLSTARHSLVFLLSGWVIFLELEQTFPFSPSCLQLYTYNIFNTICSTKTLNINNIIELRWTSKASSLCPLVWYDWGRSKLSKHRNRKQESPLSWTSVY